MPTVVVIVGLLVGIAGLVMLLLGIGVISPTILNVPGINLNLQTATPGIVVMVIGFAVALAPILMAMWVDAKRASAKGDSEQPPTYLGAVVQQSAAPTPEPPADPTYLEQTAAEPDEDETDMDEP